jgi:hypothetical protein
MMHEYASRLVEQSVPLAQVRDLLGHASITTTERYDNQKLENLQVAVTKLERGLAFSAEAASWTPAEPPGGRTEAVSARQRVTGPAVAQRSPSPAHLAGDNLSSLFQELGSDTATEPSDEALATEANQLSELSLGDWLGGRDSVVLAASPCGERRHDRRTPCRAATTSVARKWLGGRDSNPDNVVQSAVTGHTCAPVRAFSLGC